MTIRAAGALLWRRRSGRVEIAVIHRPHRGDWSLPKGKLEGGEDYRAAAHREVFEETGHRGRLGADLGEVRYEVVRDGLRTPKTVRFWAMEATQGGFSATDEVDELRWLAAADARSLLSYAGDHAVLERFLAQAGDRDAGPA